MQKTKVTENIEFAYHDSGAPPDKDDYCSIIVIHGYTYHSGTFSRMSQQASSIGHRLILPNRRLYPGSTPYTEEESKAFDLTSPTEEVAKAFLKEGGYLLLFVSNLIEKHSLKKVILVGWSLGTMFLCSAIGSITALTDDTKSRLLRTIRAFVFWDPPATVIGIPSPPSGGWTPLFDETLTAEQKGQAFGEWVVQYYPHPEMEKKDCYNLIYKMAPPVKPPTFSDIPVKELLSKIDLSAGPNGDSRFVNLLFQPVANKIKDLALFTPGIREAWRDTSFNIIYGEETIYNVVWAAWQLEAEAERTGLPLKIRGIPGANHFPMHDLPKVTFDTLLACL